MRCPACRAEMLVLEFQRVEVDYCPACAGCWLDQGELELICGAAAPAETIAPAAPTKHGRRRCPHCGRRMPVGPLPGTAVEVDVCPVSHGMWLDRGELRAILAAREAAGVSAPLAQYWQDLFGEREGKEQAT